MPVAYLSEQRISKMPTMLLSHLKPVMLAVLDDRERSHSLRASLSSGWIVVRAHSCAEARARALEQPIDALVTDLVLVDGSAFGLLRSLAMAPPLSLVLTSGNQHGIRERIIASGFDLHLPRSVSAEEIHTALRKKLAEKQREQGRPRGSPFSAPRSR